MARNAGMNIADPVSSAIKGVEFGVLSADEIKSLSVKRITAAVTFDTLGHPVPNGLHDLALGAALGSPCATCNLDEFRCPGHSGHIDLPVPIYHPTFMDQLLRLLRAQCQYCHGLKMSKVTTHLYSCKLRLIHHGLLKETAELEVVEAPKVKGSKEEGEDVESEDSDAEAQDIIQKREAYVKRVLKEAGIRKTSDGLQNRTEAAAEERKYIIKDFLSDINKSRKCANCGGISPSFRKDRYVKIFKKGLNKRDKNAMIQKGIKVTAPIVEEVARKRALQASKDKDGSDRMDVDEGVADMGEEDSEGESLDADEEIAGGLIADASMTATKKKQKIEDEGEGQSYVSSSEVLYSLERLFEKEQDILSHVYGPRSRRKGGKVRAEMFFIKAMVVPPNKFRPEAKTGDSIAEASINSLYKGILTACDTINQIVQEIKTGSGLQGRPARTYDSLQDAIVGLQDAVNSLIDRDRNPTQGAAGKRNEDGIKQKLEKKEGLFRKHMMGKRVNFAARSVISPDPNLNSNEIGVPPVFAKKLHYPEPVTSHNFDELKEAVLNGPDKWPGAVAVEDENGSVTLLAKKNYEERVAIANQLLAPSSGATFSGARNKKVYRHLNNGDVVIMNRQPTLHKPSMMVHRARVLPGERTIRMHYANCNTYNADFDGDEMNMHFPQNELARAEAATIADADHQYLSATAGAPLRGLIQDHITLCVLLCSKDTFFSKGDYQNLVYGGLRPEDGHTTSGRLLTVPPTIWKPRPLWTGKQVITTLLKNIKPEAHGPLTFTSKSQTAAERWGKGSEEGNVLFKDGELLTGILDKKQIGPAGGGLVNAVYEAYGHTAAGRVLSALGRMLTKLLHMWAHSCGVQDLILTAEGERARREALEAAETVGLEVASKYVSLTNSKIRSDNPELLRRLEAVHRDDSKQHGLDQLTNVASGAVSSAVTSACLPDHLIKQFPANQMQRMTGTGAKGSPVNANLISCNLGQQVLEGRRVPVMVSGKTLPCFRPYESSIRAGGYIVDRFLTGIRPQEYYFHTMAGREGLIDTAVKTSRSGYLQRCLIKGMEGLKVHYDTTVRDSDGSMIQFLYGEDGLDPTRARYLNDFKFSAENFKSVFESMDVRGQLSRLQNDEASEWNKSASKKYRKTGDLGCMDPALAKWNPSRYAVTSENFYQAKKEYLDKNPDRLIKDKKQKVETGLSKKTFNALLDIKYLKSLIEPGEAVGVVAGQSIGEPSTQMTLNTFHLAGHSAKNVTLGIPRLREIVMTASAAISTPSMTLYVNDEVTKEESERFAKGISRLSLAQIIDDVSVNESLGRGVAYSQAKIYKIRLNFFPAKEYCEEYAITIKDVERAIETKFLHRLRKLIRDILKKKGQEKTLKTAAKSDALPEVGKSSRTVKQHQGRAQAEGEEADEGDGVDDDEDDDDDGEDEDATNDKQKANRQMATSYENPDDDEEAIAADNRQRDATPDPMQEDETYGGSPKPGQSSDDDSESESGSRPRKTTKAVATEREQRIMSKVEDVTSFKFDDVKGQWCEVTFEYDVSTAKLLMLNLVETACKDAVIQAVPGIKSCLATTEKVGTEKVPVVIVDGSNMTALRDHQNVHDPNRMYTNDIAQILRLYGVEAARASIVREMSAVFGGHGIDVNNRHLNLIADVMTRGGGYKPFNRIGLKSNVSPFMKMSFETTVGFLKDAVLEEDVDTLDNPSARIVIGKLNNVGTGAFDVLTPVA
ncbi:dna-directed rna polymerase i subunit rpa1 [Diplodia corticola]|uniref:DNA-directed RNA polymerase subunit n=1 Tax=Diplodia corticola TaxID=236234 RepID=A0A1J9RAK4_9PEZI|nr:dna-directed rna polymerase i subunit rpa1 [Diplodia corticola]OJD37194.1 dna-directed rna polymerase i subunit rpa1 [Diplodia corticola]